MVTMKNLANETVSAMPEATTPGDWVEAHGDYLFNFAIGQLRDAGVAEDLVQETFLAALKARDRFTGKSSERTWLIGILRHKIYDHLRHTCREGAVRVDTAPMRRDEDAWDDAVLWVHEVAVECQLPSRRLELAEFRANLEMALGRLPARVAQVFQLYAIGASSNKSRKRSSLSASASLDLPPQVLVRKTIVQRRRHRARHLLDQPASQMCVGPAGRRHEEQQRRARGRR